jgi:hypothetical protein
MNLKFLISLILTFVDIEYVNLVSFHQTFTYKSASSLSITGSYKSISARFHTKCTGVCTQDSQCLTSYFNADLKQCHFFDKRPLSSEYISVSNADSRVHVKYS